MSSDFLICSNKPRSILESKFSASLNLIMTYSDLRTRTNNGVIEIELNFFFSTKYSTLARLPRLQTWEEVLPINESRYVVNSFLAFRGESGQEVPTPLESGLVLTLEPIRSIF